MPSGFKKGGIDLDSLFEPIGISTKGADIGYKSGGVDISNRYHSLSGGGTKRDDVGYKKGGVDISNNFAKIGSVSYYTGGDWGSVGGVPTVTLPSGETVVLDFWKTVRIVGSNNVANWIQDNENLTITDHDVVASGLPVGSEIDRVRELWTGRAMMDTSIYFESSTYGGNDYQKVYTFYCFVTVLGSVDVIWFAQHNMYNYYSPAPFKTTGMEGFLEAGVSNNQLTEIWGANTEIIIMPINKAIRGVFEGWDNLHSRFYHGNFYQNWINDPIGADKSTFKVPTKLFAYWCVDIYNYCVSQAFLPPYKIGSDYFAGKWGAIGGAPIATGINGTATFQYLGTLNGGLNANPIFTSFYTRTVAENATSLSNINNALGQALMEYDSSASRKAFVVEIWGISSDHIFESFDTHLLWGMFGSNGQNIGGLNYRNTGYEGGTLDSVTFTNHSKWEDSPDNQLNDPSSNFNTYATSHTPILPS